MPSQNAQQIPDEREVGTRPSFHHVTPVLLPRPHGERNVRASRPPLAVIEVGENPVGPGPGWRLDGSNSPLYPSWQEYFRTHQPPVLIAWGKNDQIFPAAGAEPYKRDLKTLEYHLLDAGHFALETNGDEIARLMREFLDKHVAKK